ncbi:hypothetical protein WDZ17_10335 [Pseudokineococcus basanitobsidens]|uniref:Tetratricopeptide repeat protein n=1 Tax=Pseudokineococcus basanitobsidens TaxID=1926649 RepID=A0ABU8RL03_9ACTN
MSLLEKLRRRVARSAPESIKPALRRVDPVAKRSSGHGHPDDRREDALRARLHEDPNDESAFVELAGIVRRRAAENHAEGDPRRAEDDAVWALAEEMAGSSRAWYPLLELGRLSIHDDREGAMRRLATAAERDATGGALAQALSILREEGLPGDALGLGVGHWRPREHRIDAGVQLVHAAVEAGRVSEARRHLEAMSLHPDSARVEVVQAELERVIAGAEGSPAR